MDLPEPLVVGPDDYLVVNLGPKVSMAQIDAARSQLVNEWGPNTRVLIVSAQEVALMKGGSE